MKKKDNIKILLLNIEEISGYLGVSKQTIYDWVYKKEIPYHKVGRLLRFDLNEINEWIRRASWIHRHHSPKVKNIQLKGNMLDNWKLSSWRDS